jgi:predicted dehydrogenase
MGTGWIAERFVGSVQQHTRQSVVAVGSRTLDGARRFADRSGVAVAHGSYDDLVADPAVDVIYVATPHNTHYDCAVLALAAGKHTLVEKPLALNAIQASGIADLARAKGLFCMEAFWTIFLPKLDVVIQLLADGSLGHVATVLADHGEFFADDHRILRPDLAGGSLLDLGIYPVVFAMSVFGKPAHIVARGQGARTLVNAQAAIILSTETGDQAVLHTTLLSNTPTTATIAGDAATLTLAGPFFQPGDFSLTSADGRHRLDYSEAATGHGALHYEVAHVARCIEAGLTESPMRPMADSIATLEVLDEIRRQLGVRFREETQ